MAELKRNKIIFELLLSFVTLVMLGITLFFMLIICILPINNYHHSPGFVEYKCQHILVSQVEGVIENVFKENNSSVEKGDSIFRYSSEKNNLEIASLDVKESFLRNEFATISKLNQLGILQSVEIDKKKLEIDELQVQKNFFKRTVIAAPISGKIYYHVLPKYIEGTYIEKGQELGIIYTSEEKHIKISFPNEFADRFKIGSNVLIKYKDPSSFKIQKMRGIIYYKFLNQKKATVELFCEVETGKECLTYLQPGTVVSTATVINNTSIYEDLLGIPVSPWLQKVILKNRVYEKIKKYL